MRRKDREITDLNEIYSIMKKCDSCSVAFFDNEFPYIVPLNFGLEFNNNQFTLYFHSANAGTKLELLSQNSHVAFEMSCSHKLLLGETACASTMEYESVCGNGIMTLLSENDDKRQALTHLMSQYQNKSSFEFDENELKAVAVMKLEVKHISGKRLRKH